jgi:hypothetical protein
LISALGYCQQSVAEHQLLQAAVIGQILPLLTGSYNESLAALATDRNRPESDGQPNPCPNQAFVVASISTWKQKSNDCPECPSSYII